MTPVIVIRPQPGCGATVSAARAMGLHAHAYPLFAVHPATWTAPDPRAFDAVLIGSANVLRHGGDQLARYHAKPVYAVGRTTAQAARNAGFDHVIAGNGGLQAAFAHLAPGHRTLLRLAGRDRVDLTPPPGVRVAEHIVYASDPCPMPGALADMLRSQALVLLHSGEAARHFASECDRLDIGRGRIRLALIGPRVAEAAGSGWADVRAAPMPDDASLLALAGEMCQIPGKV